ncbi:hypothetical protein FQR65_LT11762 [Abscondita terminalis]|nr:hypothetical protein FQR65_LT11762 [Abscondita terminalis]
MLDLLGTEDCLYLYIYVPKEVITGTENMSVVVHIHGGAFMLGAPMYFAGPDYITDKDVVYVSFNYRVGIMGFLSTEDEIVPGNNGLKDQVMALKWIQKHIKHFGGNPNSVTITGLSAGGASVHYHYLSPLSTGLFHRGFSQSGTALNMWALTEKPLQKTKKLAKFLNCTTESTKEMISCLKKEKDVNIITALKQFFVLINAVPFTPFGPVIEKGNKAFLPDHPYKLLVEGKVNDCPWVASNTKNEGIYPVGFFVLYGKLQELDKNWDLLIPAALDYYDTVKDEDKILIAQKLKTLYLNNESLSMENINKLIDLFTDRLFLIDGETAIRLQAKVTKSPVYYYFYEYNTQSKTLFSKTIKGSAHSDDGRLLFKIIGNPNVLPDDDQKMKDELTEFIYCFATKGIPLKRHKSVREQLHLVPNLKKHGIDFEWILKPHKHNSTKDSIALFHYLDSEFYGEVQIGQEPQTFNMVFDTSWSRSWVISNDCTWTSPGCWLHQKYDHTKSFTYRPNGRKFISDQGTYNFTGYYSNDTFLVSICSSLINGQLFVEMTGLPADQALKKSDGAIGLGFKTDWYDPLFYSMLKNKSIRKPLFSIYLKRDGQSHQGGNIMLGFIDKQHIHTIVDPNTNKTFREEITYLPVNSHDEYWSFNMDGVTLDITEQNKTKTYEFCMGGCQAFVDTATTVIMAPPKDVDNINKLIGATSLVVGRYSVKCDRLNKLPPIEFVLAGKKFTLKGEQYTQRMNVGPLTFCVSAFVKSDVPNEQKFWILGAAFLSQFYSIYDVGHKRIGFVTAA